MNSDLLRSKLQAKYAIWKDNLLDLSARNRLLNFRPTKVSTIRLSSPDAGALFEQLVLNEKSLSFPLFEGSTYLVSEASTWTVNTEVKPKKYRVRPGDLESDKTPPDLDKALQRLAQAARTSFEERGVNTLYVALGMLEWYPQVGANPQRAPLLMVPVALDRENRLKPFILSPFDEDPEVNPTLIYMLRKDFDYAAPEFDLEPTPASLNKFFAKLQSAVKGRSWRVLSEAWLGQFQFKKLSMYRDLDDHLEAAFDHRLMQKLAGSGEDLASPEILSEGEFDSIPPSQVFTVRDADSSQLACLFHVRGGRDLVIQGPPGTGKSQTIANLIAQLLLEGKKVLFVSEKMAALSVVYRRLQEAGLGPFCLEVHSDKANKRDVVSRIRRAKKNRGPDPWHARLEFDKLTSLRRGLNDYAQALHRPCLNGKSAFNLHGELAMLDGVPDVIAHVNVRPEELTQKRIDELLQLARRLARMPQVLRQHRYHPWRGCTIGGRSGQPDPSHCVSK